MCGVMCVCLCVCCGLLCQDASARIEELRNLARAKLNFIDSRARIVYEPRSNSKLAWCSTYHQVIARICVCVLPTEVPSTRKLFRFGIHKLIVSGVVGGMCLQSLAHTPESWYWCVDLIV